MSVPRLHQRASGVLLHPTSLPGPFGNGDIGKAAFAFADFLASAGQSFWQMLPTGPLGYGNSPYSAQSAFAGNALLIDLTQLQELGLLTTVPDAPHLPKAHVDYAQVAPWRETVLRTAYGRYRESKQLRAEAESYFEKEREWIFDYALFRAIKRAHGEVEWTKWSVDLRDRKPTALAEARQKFDGDVGYFLFEQWLFDRQWQRFRSYCHAKGIALIGDIPIFVAHDSADVWQHRELFRLDENGLPSVVAGVPPDYFSKTGQLWGNPLYRWKVLARSGYRWWSERLRTTLARVDVVRLDHFIGFQRYWEIPAADTTAQNGRWVRGPGANFFAALQKELGSLPLIAEDLGAVTPKVTALRKQFKLPGLRILQFAFGTDPQAPSFLPHKYARRSVVYTGTHDNDTVRGWFDDEGGDDTPRSEEQVENERRAVMQYLGSDGFAIHWDMIRMIMMSVANLAITPLQDIFGLGSEARMNRPGTLSGNWEWRFTRDMLTPHVAERLYELTKTYGRLRSENTGDGATTENR